MASDTLVWAISTWTWAKLAAAASHLDAGTMRLMPIGAWAKLAD